MSLLLEQLRIGGRTLEKGPNRRKIAEQRDKPSFILNRLVARPDNRAIDPR
ncbi:hypothetical protein [Acidisoma sp. L85]|uniref:hypothetical protein n=1 Tax=Acidisoma sp. L85 TaxID=1641850 RepID=UPI0020B16575|nr:hypothetical protein [Acidisoma sp. L85]